MAFLLTQHNQEIAQWSPDPFPRERVGSGHETTISIAGKAPYLEYGSQVWDPHLQKDINQLESVQKIWTESMCKQWDLSYDELLSNFTHIK